MNPRVSVIIPTYRNNRTLGDSVRSALSQTVADIEVIVVHVCPGGESETILGDIAKEDPRLRIFDINENIGVAGARNRGVQDAKGERIAFLDSDDLWEPDKLSRQMEAAGITGAALVYTAAACIDSAGSPTGKIFSVPASVSAKKLLYGNDIITSTVLVNRDALLRHPMERSDLHEDFICWYRILSDGERAVGINEPLARYRISEGSKSGNKRKSAVMTWKTYKYLGVGFFRRILCFAGYCVHGVKRYWL